MTSTHLEQESINSDECCNMRGTEGFKASQMTKAKPKRGNKTARGALSAVILLQTLCINEQKSLSLERSTSYPYPEIPSTQNKGLNTTLGQDIQRLPQNTAIVGKVLLDIVLDPKRKYDLPVTMLTALPIYDDNGSMAVPENSLITAIIQNKDGGDYITIDKLVYKGLNIRLPSQGRLIPAQIKPENYGNYIVPPKSKASSVISSADTSSLTSTLLGIALAGTYFNKNDGTQSQNITPLLLGVLGIDVGIKVLAALFDSKPQRLPPLVEIPKDSLIVFTLQESTILPNSAAPDSSIKTTSP